MREQPLAKVLLVSLLVPHRRLVVALVKNIEPDVGPWVQKSNLTPPLCQLVDNIHGRIIQVEYLSVFLQA